jgi:hypothetical protein
MAGAQSGALDGIQENGPVPLVESLTVGGVLLYRSHVVPAFLGGRVGQKASTASH